MPAGWDEFTVTELASVLGESRGAAEGLLDLAYVLEVKLPGTRAAFRDGTLRQSKAEIITRATTVLDPPPLLLYPAARARSPPVEVPRQGAQRREQAARTPGCSGGPRIRGTPR